MHEKGCSLRLVIRREEVCLEGLATVAGKADFGGDPATNEHDMGEETAEG